MFDKNSDDFQYSSCSSVSTLVRLKTLEWKTRHARCRTGKRANSLWKAKVHLCICERHMCVSACTNMQSICLLSLRDLFWSCSTFQSQ